MIFMSDETHLSNFAGDKQVWPVYMTIANVSPKIRLIPSVHTVVVMAVCHPNDQYNIY
jgi:hypothetical protein